ncbi:MAG TPA: hypothetical protein VJ694_01800 [Patescibacteria group bacterium]|nr:hypothetical protein [Patescibacteria group bacterium]
MATEQKQRKTIIAFAGRNCCGKGTAAEHAASMLNAPKHTYSDVLYEIHGVCGIPRPAVPRSNLQDLSTFVRDWFGQDCLARVMAKKCEAAAASYVVIDGVRRLDDIVILQAEYGDALILVWIEASADNRYARAKLRKEKAGEEFKTREAFDEEEKAESEIQLDLVRQACRTVIDNDGPPEALAPQVEALIGAVADFGPVAHG